MDLISFATCLLDTVVKPYQTIWAGLITIFLYFFKKYREKKQDRTRIARALLAEAESIEARYLKATGGGLKPTKSIQLYWIPIGDDYLTVYKSIAGKLGLFEPTEVEAIVTFYTELSAFIDSLRFYSSESSFIREVCMSKFPIDRFVGKSVADVVAESGVPLVEYQRYYQMLCQQEESVLERMHYMQRRLQEYSGKVYHEKH